MCGQVNRPIYLGFISKSGETVGPQTKEQDLSHMHKPKKGKYLKRKGMSTSTKIDSFYGGTHEKPCRPTSSKTEKEKYNKMVAMSILNTLKY